MEFRSISSDRGREDRVAPFLLFRLQVAVVAGDRGVAHELEQEIHRRIRRGSLSPRHPIFWTDPDRLDSTIEIFRKRCISCDPHREPAQYRACVLVLLSLLYERYASRRLMRDLRDALQIRMTSRLGPLGTYCLDILFLSFSATDLDPVGANQQLATALELHNFESQCSYCSGNLPTKILRVPGMAMKGDKERGLRIPQGQTGLLTFVPRPPSVQPWRH